MPGKLPAPFLCLAVALTLSACGAMPRQPADTIITESHSVHLEGGVLKVLSAGERDLLYLYVRPRAPGRWVVAGGAGGNQSSPWLHRTTMFWALTDETGWRSDKAPRRAFTCLFDTRNKTLTVDDKTYAVSEGGLVVISLDENWRAERIRTGLHALSMFDLPEADRKQLLAGTRKQMSPRPAR